MKVCTTCGAEWPDETKFCPSDGSALKAVGGEESIVGGILHSYHIIKKLGEGGMGAVYLGEHVKMGRKSAVKVMTQSLAQDTDAIARFNREAANAASINHVNVCAIYDFGETSDGTIFLAMEYVEGEALTDLIKREGPLDLQRASAILKQTSEALQAAHELGIVHRDLKPDNIMIAKARDGSDLVKVVDFGIAKAMGGEEGQNVTRTGLVVGTPEYMSPEQLSGDKLDGRSDVYSLALVFFKMITGTLPFQADSAQEVMIKRLTDEPTRLNEALAGGDFPPMLQAVVDRATERMPSDRYATADEFARDANEAIAAAAKFSATSPPVDTQGATELLDTRSSDPAGTGQLKKTRASEADRAAANEEAGGNVKDAATGTPQTPVPRAQMEASRKPPFLAIAGTVVVVGILGGVGYVTITGGDDRSSSSIDSAQIGQVLLNAVDSNDAQEGDRQGGAPVDSAVSQGNTDRSNTADDSAGEQRDGSPGTSTPNADSMAIDLQLEQMIRRITERATVQQAREDAEAIFLNQAASLIQKAQAAYQLALSYNPVFDLDGASVAMACTWIERALGFDPENNNYLEFQQGNCNL